MRGSSSTTRMVATTATILGPVIARSLHRARVRRRWRGRRARGGLLAVLAAVPFLRAFLERVSGSAAHAPAVQSAAPHPAPEERHAEEPEDAENDEQEPEQAEDRADPAEEERAIAVVVVRGAVGGCRCRQMRAHAV